MKTTSRKLEKAGFEQARPDDKLFGKKKSLYGFYWEMYLFTDCFSFAFGCADGTLSIYCQAPTKVGPAAFLISLHSL